MIRMQALFVCLWWCGGACVCARVAFFQGPRLARLPFEVDRSKSLLHQMAAGEAKLARLASGRCVVVAFVAACVGVPQLVQDTDLNVLSR